MERKKAILQSTPEYDTALGIADHPWDGLGQLRPSRWQASIYRILAPARLSFCFRTSSSKRLHASNVYVTGACTMKPLPWLYLGFNSSVLWL